MEEFEKFAENTNFLDIIRFVTNTFHAPTDNEKLVDALLMMKRLYVHATPFFFSIIEHSAEKIIELLNSFNLNIAQLASEVLICSFNSVEAYENTDYIRMVISTLLKLTINQSKLDLAMTALNSACQYIPANDDFISVLIENIFNNLISEISFHSLCHLITSQDVGHLTFGINWEPLFVLLIELKRRPETTNFSNQFADVLIRKFEVDYVLQILRDIKMDPQIKKFIKDEFFSKQLY